MISKVQTVKNNKSNMNYNSKDNSVTFQYNVCLEGLSTRDAWWNMNSNDEYLQEKDENLFDFASNKQKLNHEFFFNKVEELT
ncbi:9677_t:CDS:2 [Cetraspora pellucida]|uniref:9677_t:CDS:1 n=1 Tax=Cetraspora pellucida TaxID=1433469 RepID=A0A9N9FFB0_9GLOM|nr:9677_t:CDS:2 [Cetraspora pellucida]